MDEIMDFTYRPVVDKRMASATFFAFVSLSCLAVIPSVSLERYKGVASLVAVLFFVVAMAIYSRYLIGEYAYVCFTTSEGRAVLTVTKTTGKRVSTLQYLYLSEIVAVKHYASTEEKEKPLGNVKKYNYCPSMKPKAIVELEVRVLGACSVVLLEGSREFADRIRQYSVIAVANEREE